MKLKVFNGKIKKNENVYLKLQKSSIQKNCIDLVVVDEGGYEMDAGCILTISESGIHRHTYIDSDLGFALDVEDRIRII